MDKLETLVVPEELGAWLEERGFGISGAYFTVINELFHYWENTIGSSTGDFITENKKELIEVILGTRGYEIEGPLYYALAKGHELIKGKGGWEPKYWNLNTTDGSIFIGDQATIDDKYLIKMSKEEWNKLGINDSNADFIEIGEVTE